MKPSFFLRWRVIGGFALTGALVALSLPVYKAIQQRRTTGPEDFTATGITCERPKPAGRFDINTAQAVDSTALPRRDERTCWEVAGPDGQTFEIEFSGSQWNRGEYAAIRHIIAASYPAGTRQYELRWDAGEIAPLVGIWALLGASLSVVAGLIGMAVVGLRRIAERIESTGKDKS